MEEMEMRRAWVSVWSNNILTGGSISVWTDWAQLTKYLYRIISDGAHVFSIQALKRGNLTGNLDSRHNAGFGLQTSKLNIFMFSLKQSIYYFLIDLFSFRLYSYRWVALLGLIRCIHLNIISN